MTALVRHPSPLPASLAKAARAGDLLFLSGHTPRGPDLKPVGGSIGAQTEAVEGSRAAVITRMLLAAERGAVISSLSKMADRYG